MQSVKGWICKETLEETLEKIKWENVAKDKRCYMYGVIGSKPDKKTLFDCYLMTSLSEEDQKRGLQPVIVFAFRTLERHREYTKRKKLAKSGIDIDFEKVTSFVKMIQVKGAFSKKALTNLIKNTDWGKPSTVDGKHYVYFDGVIEHNPDDQHFDCFLNIALPRSQWGTNAEVVKFLRFRTLKRHKEVLEQYSEYKKEQDACFKENPIQASDRIVPKKTDTDYDSIF